jgi:methylated-DNA-[protein]-cysteine S-methyltransferase
MKTKYQQALMFETIIEAPFGGVGVSAQGLQIDIELMPITLAAKKNGNNKLVEQVAHQIEAYFCKSNTNFNLPIKLKGTSFQRNVWQAISAIPSGQVLTYGQIAAQLKSSPRAVANACGANHLPIVIPCHRVVAKNGLGGFMRGAKNGLEIKKWLLKHEGAMDINGNLV